MDGQTAAVHGCGQSVKVLCKVRSRVLVNPCFPLDLIQDCMAQLVLDFFQLSPVP